MIVAIIFFQLLIFGGIIFFVRHMLSQNVTSATSHLQDAVAEYTKKQEEMEQKLKKAQEDYEDTIKKAKKESEILKDKSRKEVSEERDRIIEQAHRESEEIIERAQKSAEAIKAEEEKIIKEKAVEKSGELICEVLPEEVARQMHDKWVDKLISEGTGGLDRLRVPEDISRAQVATAFALSEAQRTMLKMKFQEIFNRDIELEEEVDPRLVAGLKIVLGNLILEGSFYGKVGEIVREEIVRENE